jgi:TonB family protein
MRNLSRSSITSLAIAVLTSTALQAQKGISVHENTGKPAIVSPSQPADSRGETVYESQGENQQDSPVIPGTLIAPKLIKQSLPAYSKAMKKTKFSGIVTIQGIVSSDGALIDAKVLESSNPDASKSALDAISKYQFRPGTLDGKPIATLIRINLEFKIL